MTFNFTFNDPYHAKAPSNQDGEIKPPPKHPPKTCEEWLNSSSVAGHLVSMDGTLFIPSKEDKGTVQWPNHPQHLDVLIPAAQQQGSGDQQKPTIVLRDSNPGDTIFGSLDEIKRDLEEHAPWNSSYLDSLEQRLQKLECHFDSTADHFACNSRKAAEESAVGGLMNIKDKAFMTELGEELLSLRKLYSLAGKTAADKDVSSSSQSAEGSSFPGFEKEINLPLPGKVETLAILNIVAKSAEIPPYLIKPWKKIFFCKATTSLLQNMFWWIWMEYFKADQYTQSLIFNQICEDFVSILTEMADDKYKDEIFMYYPVYLTQALYSAFCHSFPKSNTEINTPEFLEFISNIISEWILGVKSQPGQWKSWPRYFLNPFFYSLKSEKTEKRKKPFTPKDVMRLSDQVAASLVKSAPDSGQQKVKTAIVALLGTCSKRRSGLRLRSNSADSSRVEEKRPLQKFSLSNVHIRSGPIFECVRFSIYGRSPLLQHYLHRHNFTETTEPRGPAISRTQIKEIPPPGGISYGQVVAGHSYKTQKMYEDYESVMAQSNHEIALTRGKHLAKIRKEERQNTNILQHRHEVALIAEKLVASQREDKHRRDRPSSS